MLSTLKKHREYLPDLSLITTASLIVVAVGLFYAVVLPAVTEAGKHYDEQSAEWKADNDAYYTSGDVQPGDYVPPRFRDVIDTDEHGLAIR